MARTHCGKVPTAILWVAAWKLLLIDKVTSTALKHDSSRIIKDALGPHTQLETPILKRYRQFFLRPC